MPDTEKSTEKDKILLVGAHTLLGELMIDQLENSDEVEEFWVLDLHRPKAEEKYKKLRFLKYDLIAPGADAQLAKEFQNIGIKTLIHCALKNNPSLNEVYAHELEVIGTLNLVSAAKAAGLHKFILCSTTAVYGASPKNPNYIQESQALDANAANRFVRDKVEAEKQVTRLYEEASDMVVTVLRFCLTLGPRSENYFTRWFRRPVVPSLLGYDPLMQFIHENDALEALHRVCFNDYRGTFNIVGRGVIPLSYALRLAGKIKLPVLSSLAYPLVQVLWNFQTVPVPAQLLDYFKYLWVADGEKAKRIMDFEAQRSSKEAFLDFAKTDQSRSYSLAS